MSARPHHGHEELRAGQAAAEMPSRADMVDLMVDLAKDVVRSAVAAGGDPAAGVLRLLLNELSPMPAQRELEGATKADLSADANFLRGLAAMRKGAVQAKRLIAIAGRLEFFAEDETDGT